MIQLCGCVSFLVMVGNSSQNENTFLQKNLIELLIYDLLANVCFLPGGTRQGGQPNQD